MDVSDGLVGDLAQHLRESKVGARINVDLVPVAPRGDYLLRRKADWQWP